MEDAAKEQLISQIKEWIKMDSEITEYKSEIKERKKRKQELTENLVSVMKSNNIDCFDVNGGALFFKKSKVKKAINARTLPAVLKSYFTEDDKMVEEVTKHVLDHREEQIKETICRKIKKL